MFKPIFVIILIVLFLTACANPKQLENHYQEAGVNCIAIGKTMRNVEECIGFDFRESTYQGQTVKDHRSCKPYWGFPFVQSCGGIKVIYNQENIVTEWFAWGQLDGV